MRFLYNLSSKAIVACAVGVAFFLFGCQARPPVERPDAPYPPSDIFLSAERNFRVGDFQEALNGFEQYLAQKPTGPETAIALHHLAVCYRIKERYHEAEGLLEKLMEEHPDYPALSGALIERARIFYDLGDYEKTASSLMAWIRDFPNDPYNPEAFHLMASLEEVQGHLSEAFFWNLKGVQWIDAGFSSTIERFDLESRLSSLITLAPPDALEKMALYAAQTPYAPVIYDRLASTYLEMNLLSHAKRVARELMESTEDEVWYYRGMALLEMIEQAFSGEKFVVGCLLPLSGPFALYGQEVLNGIELALDPFGDSEHAAMIELVIEDTGGTAKGAFAAIERLILRKGLFVIVGPLASKAAVTAAKRANEEQVPIITLTQKDGIVMEGDFVYRSFLTPSMEVKALADHAIFEMGFRNFAILYPNNSYGQVLMDLFWERVDAWGGRITAVESYSPKETDFALQIRKLVGLHHPRPKAIRDMMRAVRAKRAEEIIDLRGEEEPFPIVDFDAVFIPDNVQHIALIAPHFPFYSVFDIRLLGTSLWQSEELIELSGEYVQGAVFPTGFYPLLEEEKVRLFVKKYTDVFEETPGVLAATGYDTVSFIKNLVIERAIRTSQELQEWLSQAAPYEGITGSFSFDASGEVEKNPLLLMVTGKSLKPIPPQQRQPHSHISPSYTSIDAP